MAGSPPIRVDIDRRALDELIRGPLTEAGLVRTAEGVRDRARANAEPISNRLAEAIFAAPVARDADGPYVDVGYDKTKPGWVLWFHEVGTRNLNATPHLRPALSAE